MENNSIFQLLKNFFLGSILLVTALLRGNLNTPSPSDLPKGIKAFIHECKEKPPYEDKVKFRDARSAQLNNSKVEALFLYRELLERYPRNSVIKYNISLIEKS